MNDTLKGKPPYAMAGAVSLAVLVLYILTLAPTTQFWDTSEYIAAAYVLGIPHPPGNPLFTIVAHVWGMLPLAAHYAARINLLAATTSAIAAGCWFLVGERWMRGIVPARGPRWAAAVAGALVGATAFTVWNQSVVNEKVYTVSLLSIALILWLIVRWDDQPEGQAHDHHLLVILYLLALTSTNHMMGVLVGPVVVVLLFPPLKTDRPPLDAARRVEWAQWAVVTSVYALIVATGLEGATPLYLAGALYVGAVLYAVRAGNWRFALVSLAVAVVGLSVYIYLPLRAAHFPAINEGEPTTWPAIWDVITRAQYGKPPVTQRQATFISQIAMWVQYFTWQWAHDLPQNFEAAIAVVFGGLGVLGAWRQWKADRRQAFAMTAVMITFTLLLVFYLNFKYRYGTHPTNRGLDEVRERDYFFICSFAMWGIWVGMGLATLMEWVQDALRSRVAQDAKRWLYATPVLVLALIPLWANWGTASRKGETLARDFAEDLLNSVEPYGVLVTAGDNDTFPLWFAQEVEGVRRDVTVVNLSLANTDWYLRQMQRRPVATYDAAHGPAIYRNGTWVKPSGPPMDLTPEAVAQIQLAYPVGQPATLHFGTVPVTIDPQLLGKDYLERADVVVLKIIQDQMGKRPIYFSRTAGDYPDQFGLSQYLEGQGFARKLDPHPLTANDSIVTVPGFGFVNLPRTETLLDQVYHKAGAARPRPYGWVDKPSEGILITYGMMYGALADALAQKNPKAALDATATAEAICANTTIPAAACASRAARN